MQSKGITKVAIVGCGAISELYYAPVLIEMEAGGISRVAILFDPDPSRTAKLKASFPQAAATTDFHSVTGSGIDLAIVASPPRFHAQQSIELLNHGIAVLCEKPMAATLGECERMLQAAAKSKKAFAVGLFRRLFPVNQMIREMIRNQSLGPVKSFEILEGGQFTWPAQSASFFQKTNSQGGVLADLGVHVLDILIWWFGMPERVVYEDDAMGGLEANCRLELDFPNGVRGIVRLSRDTNLTNRTILEFERGWVRCKAASSDELEIGFPDNPYALGGRLVQLDARGSYGFRTQSALSYHQSFAKQLRNVVASVRGEEPVFIPGNEGIRSMRLIEHCYCQRKLMAMPWLTETEFQTAQRLVQNA